MREIALVAMTKIMKLTLSLLLCWPLPQSPTIVQLLRQNVARFLSIVNALLAMATGFSCSMKDGSNLAKFSYKLGFAFCSLYFIIHMIMLAMYEDRIRIFISFAVETYKQVDSDQNVILQKYIDCCLPYNICVTVWIYTCSGLVLITSFAYDVDNIKTYLVPVDNQLAKYLYWLSGAFCMLQCTAALVSNVFIGCLFLILSAKFDILSLDFQKMNNVDEIILCVKKHQALLSYVNTLTMTATNLLLTCIIFCILTLVLSAIMLLSSELFEVKLDFMLIAFGVFIQIHVITAPIDRLRESSQQLGFAAYNSMWYEKNVTQQQYLLNIIQRCQKPVVVSLCWLIPNLSLQHYRTLLSKSLSYYAFLYTVIPKEERNCPYHVRI